MKVIPFNTDISQASIEALLAKLQGNTGQGMVLIHSPGGEFEFFSRLAPPLARTGFTAVGVRVASAAIILQLLGKKRLATPEATFFFHEVRTFIGEHGEVTICDLETFLLREQEMRNRMKDSDRELIKSWYTSMEYAQRWMLSFIQEQTGFRQGEFANLMRGEVTLTAQEARQYGLVHRIISVDELLAHHSKSHK